MSHKSDGLTAVSNDASFPQTAIKSKELHPSTLAVHADDGLNRTADVVPPLHVATTFHYAQDPNDLVPAAEFVVSCVPY